MQNVRAFLTWAALSMLCAAWAQTATAQAAGGAATPAKAPVAAPAATPAPAPAATPTTPVAAPAPEAAPADDLPPSPPPASECFPACRAGHVCHEGQCISACNPPCREGELCTAEGQCEREQAPPPPTYVGVMSESDVPPPPPPEPEGVHTHDGFMLRFTAGFGGGGMREEYDGSLLGVETSGEADYSGGGVTLGLDLGAALSPNFSLHGRLAMFQLIEPKLSVNDTEGTLQDTYLVSVLLGIGATYTLMPLNLYFTGAVGLGALALSYRPDDDPDNDRSDGSDAGLSLNVDIGKEWWVSRQTGIGVAARFWLTTAHFENDFRDSDMRFLAGAILFSLTYQ